MKGGVWAFSESAEVSDELASAANPLAAALSSTAVSVELGKPRTGVALLPRRLVLRWTSGGYRSPEAVAEALFRAVKLEAPSVILIGGTRKGREVAARLAARLGWGCISEATAITSETGAIMGERSAFAGKVSAKVRGSVPCIVTVKVGAFPRSAAGVEAIVAEIDVGEITTRTKITSSIAKKLGSVDLKSARTIVSAGRGVKRKEDLSIIESLALNMGGAVGCSRPLSSDLGWLPEEHHIGLTGTTVKPDLYVAVGISGQLQHVAGIKDSKVVVAINTDKDAPIFAASDYGIVGDLYQVIPALDRAVKSRRG